jgi:type VI secretion system protein ImpG
VDREFLKHYNAELQHVRETAGEFATGFPKIAGRLGLSEFGCADPYVERLLEGFAYLAARVHHRMDREFPRFTEGILNTVYPDYLLPTPSMTVAHLQIDPNENALAQGVAVPAGTRFQSTEVGEDTPCVFRTAGEFTLWPLTVVNASFHTRDIATLGLPGRKLPRAAIRIRVRSGDGVPLAGLPVDKLRFFVRSAGDELAMRIYESLFAHCGSIALLDPEDDGAEPAVLPASSLHQVGFERGQALVPWDARTFNGFRLLREYFAFPERFMFFEVSGLAPAFARAAGHGLDLVFCLNAADSALEGNVRASNFLLHCAPMCNCFEMRLDNVHLESRSSEYHVVANRWSPLDHEILRLTRVEGVGPRIAKAVQFQPLYSNWDRPGGDAYYVLHRRARSLSEKERREGSRSTYMGSEVYLSMVDTGDAPYSTDLRRLSLSGLCSNRDLPLHMPLGQGTTDLSPETFLPVPAVRCIAGPTSPLPAPALGQSQWQIINHLALNYLSLLDEGDGMAVQAMREMLRLYGGANSATIDRQINGVADIATQAVVRRAPGTGPASFIRGLEVTVTLNEDMFSGLGGFLLGAVMDRFISSYVSINTFTQTVVDSQSRGEIMRWPTRTGTSVIP